MDNDGSIGSCFTVAGKDFVYNETNYTNKPFITLDTSEDGSGTTMDYIFITGVGTAEDYAGIDVAGKVAFCSRGTTSFYEKAEVAVGLGAIATVVCNNQPGVINMDLTDYKQTAPCISITQANAAYIKEHSEEAVTEGGLTYYTGTLAVEGQKLSVSPNYSPYYTMSEFSSWGVPSDLSMKPEITAPGGSICSVNGAVAATDQYELMSGTSMAAPQIAGITALVKQYIREKELSQDGMTDRALAQSLMMSTAVPLRDADGNCARPCGRAPAPLPTTAAATSADSYVFWVNGQDDGKVKAELGEDAGREGVYSLWLHPQQPDRRNQGV
ncbi:MAG: S8 family serine peptidase [Oscillospiraceae bacterium]